MRYVGEGIVGPFDMQDRGRREGGVAAALVAGLTLLVLGGCTEGRTPIDASPTGRPEATAQSPLARSSWQPGQSAMSAAISGTLKLGEDGCVRLIEQGDHGAVWPVLWPVGWIAEVAAGEVVIRDPSRSDANVYRTSELVDLGGGFLQPDRYQAQTCASGPAWQVVG